MERMVLAFLPAEFTAEMQKEHAVIAKPGEPKFLLPFFVSDQAPVNDKEKARDNQSVIVSD